MLKQIIILLGLSQTKEAFLRVESNGNTVAMEVQGNNDYYGPLYVGSNFEYTHVVYDTTSAWTSVNIQGASGAKMVSDYDTQESITDYPIFHPVYDA